MAKRKRLTPATPGFLDTESPVLETKSMSPAPAYARAPIAQVAGEAATASALQELASEVKRAKDEGRMIQMLPADQIEMSYLVRDRMGADEEEMQVLMDSLRARGQQTPVEVVDLGEGRYGLISGWRRLTAMRRLFAETGEDRFAQIKALLRRPENAAEAYVAMVEENEIRVGLSYYERARVVAIAVDQGVYETDKQALNALFASASRSKRSKIKSFLTLYHALDAHLRFATSIGERQGLTLAKLLDAEPARAVDLVQALQDAAPETAKDETACLERALRPAAKQSLTQPLETAPEPKRPMPNGVDRLTDDLQAQYSGYSLTLSGRGMSEAFRVRLLDWIKANA